MRDKIIEIQYLNWFIALIVVVSFQSKTAAQLPSPGGVESPTFWITTSKVNNKFILKDLGNLRIEMNSLKEKSLNINFHDSYYLDGFEELIFHNIKFSQPTVVGVFFPEYDSSLGLNKKFYSLIQDGTAVYDFNSGNIKIEKTELTSTQILDFKDSDDFDLNDKKELIVSMKTGGYSYARMPDNINNQWGEDREAKMKFNFKGYLPELLIYEWRLTDEQWNRVHTYFAIKYGLTLKMNYYSSDGFIVWDPEKNKLFPYRVSAIGKDKNGALSQPKSNTTYEEFYGSGYSFNYSSKSENRSVSIGYKESDFLNLEDKNFLFWSDNGESIATEDLVEISPQFPKLFATKRKWKMQNEKLINLSTQITIGNPLLHELKSKIIKPCYYFLFDDGHLDISDIFPLTDTGVDNIKWNAENICFKFGVAEKLRFMVKEASTNFNEKRCGNIVEKKQMYDDFEKGYYYYKSDLNDFECRKNVVFKYITNSNLTFYAYGGIGNYTYNITDDTGPKTNHLLKLSSYEYSISGIAMTRNKKYKLTITDETNQSIELILAIK